MSNDDQPKARTTVSLPASVARRLYVEAKTSDRSVSAVVNEALTRYFADPVTPPLPSFIGIAEGDGEQVAERDEQVTREIVRRKAGA